MIGLEFVYFIRPGTQPFVKIGRAHDVPARLHGLQWAKK